MSREKLLSTFDELERNFKTLYEIGLKRPAKMQNLSQKILNQVTKIQDQS